MAKRALTYRNVSFSEVLYIYLLFVHLRRRYKVAQKWTRNALLSYKNKIVFSLSSNTVFVYISNMERMTLLFLLFRSLSVKRLRHLFHTTQVLKGGSNIDDNKRSRRSEKTWEMRISHTWWAGKKYPIDLASSPAPWVTKVLLLGCTVSEILLSFTWTDRISPLRRKEETNTVRFAANSNLLQCFFRNWGNLYRIVSLSPGCRCGKGNIIKTLLFLSLSLCSFFSTRKSLL